MKTKYSFLVAVVFVMLFSCEDEPTSTQTIDTTPQKTVTVPAFIVDSAFHYVEKQVSFGPRNPNSTGHQMCKEYLANKLRSFGAKVILQDFKAQTYRGDAFDATNIIGQYNPDNRERILLAAHWDTRFFAEQDPDENKKEEPILGADDGASGVGVLLEIARLLQANPIELGVDIIFFDAEFSTFRATLW